MPRLRKYNELDVDERAAYEQVVRLNEAIRGEIKRLRKIASSPRQYSDAERNRSQRAIDRYHQDSFLLSEVLKDIRRIG